MPKRITKIPVTIFNNNITAFLKCTFSVGRSFKPAILNNAIVINSIWFNIKVDLKTIYEMNVKESFLDKIFKLNTKSLEVKMFSQRRKKFTIHFIEENVVKLKQEITNLIVGNSSNIEVLKTREYGNENKI